MKRYLLPILVLIIAIPTFIEAQNNSRESASKQSGDEIVQLLSDFLRLDTTNPPGNENRATRFFGRILEKEQVSYQVFESAPGRANLYARLKGNGRKRPLVLLNHTDVVPADRQFWHTDPFGGEIKDGYLYGRGALDMKGLGAAQFVTFLMLKRNAVRLERDVIFLATADEEAGGRGGAGWFVENHFDLIKDAEFLITEGSNNLVVGNRVLYYGVGTTEKSPCWLRLTARGTPGHGSVPRSDSAPSKLLRALARLEAYETELKAVPAVARHFRSIAAFQRDQELKLAFSDAAAALKDTRLRNLLVSNPQNLALLRNTIQPTVVQVGSKTNVIAPIATAEIDCRLLPGEQPEAFIAQIKRVIGDPDIEVETLLSFASTESAQDTELYRAITAVIRSQDPGAVIVPTVLSGFTDSHFFRNRGIVAYGFSPFLIPASDFGGVHGNDERIPVEALRQGTQLYYRIVRDLCSAQS